MGKVIRDVTFEGCSVTEAGYACWEVDEEAWRQVQGKKLYQAEKSERAHIAARQDRLGKIQRRVFGNKLERKPWLIYLCDVLQVPQNKRLRFHVRVEEVE